MGREIRMVPENWEHPKDSKGNHIPLSEGFKELLEQWKEEKAQWEKGFRRSYFKDEEWTPKNNEEKSMSFEEWDGGCPEEEDYMPEWKEEEKTHLMMYENVSEGTPISPAFKTPEELARWLTDNNASAFADMTASYDDWLTTCKSGFAISVVSTPSGVMMTGVTAQNLLKLQKD